MKYDILIAINYNKWNEKKKKNNNEKKESEHLFEKLEFSLFLSFFESKPVLVSLK